MRVRGIVSVVVVAIGFVAMTFASEQGQNDPARYVPVLPAVKARALPVDPAKGYLVKQIKPSVFVITDGVYQSAFVTTGQGVILIDAPESFAPRIPQAVAEVTKEPIQQIVYSHTHVDHIGGAGYLVQQIPHLRIVAEQGVTEYLRGKNDRRRPVPTSTFASGRTIVLGSARLEIKRANWHSDEGDLFIYLPNQKVLIAIDTLSAGYVPFMDFDLSSNFHNHLKVFDELLAYDFDVLVPGHLTSLATRDDVRESKDYALDVYRTVKRIHEGTDQMQVMSAAAALYTWDNKYAIFRTLLDGVIDKCDAEIKARWVNTLAGVDIWGSSHCRAALIYARWDD